MKVTIRAYEMRDAAGVADVFYRSVREVALSDYTPEQVKAWAPGRLDVERTHLRSSDGRLGQRPPVCTFSLISNTQGGVRSNCHSLPRSA